jgi:hypothetical protein
MLPRMCASAAEEGAPATLTLPVEAPILSSDLDVTPEQPSNPFLRLGLDERLVVRSSCSLNIVPAPHGTSRPLPVVHTFARAFHICDCRRTWRH